MTAIQTPRGGFGGREIGSCGLLGASSLALLAALVLAWSAPTASAGLPFRSYRATSVQGLWALLKPDRHIRRANRYLARCLAPTSPAGVDVHDRDVAQGEFVAWWGAGEFQSGTVQVWWAHWPRRDHNPTLAGVIFSTFGIGVDSDLYRRVDACTTQAVNRDEARG